MEPIPTTKARTPVTSFEDIKTYVTNHYLALTKATKSTPTDETTILDSTNQILTLLDQIQPRVREIEIREETDRLGKTPDFLTMVKIGNTARLTALEIAYETVLPPLPGQE